ncbi:MAG: lipoyl synthase [Acidimicrobiia bacterium]|nr:lipoyl synthase [Acidimicrobiia bacterium]MDH5289564.1 lipoyl synthase [Acidimicrobiia bacterium]
MTGRLNSPERAGPLRARWLGTVAYAEAWDLQQALFPGVHDHLLLCQHPPVYTLGVRADEAHVLVDPAAVGAELLRVDRGGDVTFHGPGQLVGYPVMTVPSQRGGGLADTRAWVRSVEQVLIDAVAELGLEAGRLPGHPGVWLDADAHPDAGPQRQPRKLAAIGVRLARARSMHGFALNVDVDLGWFGHIVPCGIADKGVTSLAAEGVRATVPEAAAVVARHAARLLAPGRPVELAAGDDWPGVVPAPEPSAFTTGAAAAADPFPPVPTAPPAGGEERGGVPVRLRTRLDRAGVGDGMDLAERKPPWMKARVRTDPGYRELKRLSRQLDLVTVCEEAGCPNIYECWNEGTATFMLLGERCTRACGFCAVDTSKPLPPDSTEPERVAEAIDHLGLDHAVLTMVARDDLPDGGADLVARSVEAIRRRRPATGVEVLISDLKGSAEALARICATSPDVVNHNIETVARLQRAVRPSAGYARSLTVLARAARAGLVTKSGLIVGMGEETAEVKATLADLAAVGTRIVTIGQYLRPSARHLPLQRWWTPDELTELKAYGEGELGIAHVEASPLTRSSHRAAGAAGAARAAGAAGAARAGAARAAGAADGGARGAGAGDQPEETALR